LDSINTNAGLITNFEVSKTLEAQKSRNKLLKRATKDMIFVEKQVCIRYYALEGCKRPKRFDTNLKY